jgi:hypothetical protein
MAQSSSFKLGVFHLKHLTFFACFRLAGILFQLSDTLCEKNFLLISSLDVCKAVYCSNFSSPFYLLFKVCTKGPDREKLKERKIVYFINDSVNNIFKIFLHAIYYRYAFKFQVDRVRGFNEEPRLRGTARIGP